MQAKDGGRKVVAVISSNEGSVSPVAAAARNADAPKGPFDVMLPSYRASKAALNRCEYPGVLKTQPAVRAFSVADSIVPRLNFGCVGSPYVNTTAPPFRCSTTAHGREATCNLPFCSCTKLNVLTLVMV